MFIPLPCFLLAMKIRDHCSMPLKAHPTEVCTAHQSNLPQKDGFIITFGSRWLFRSRMSNHLCFQNSSPSYSAGLLCILPGSCYFLHLAYFVTTPCCSFWLCWFSPKFPDYSWVCCTYQTLSAGAVISGCPAVSTARADCSTWRNDLQRIFESPRKWHNAVEQLVIFTGININPDPGIMTASCAAWKLCLAEVMYS